MNIRFATAIAVLTLVFAGLCAAAAPDITGRWQGTLEMDEAELTLYVDVVRNADGTLAAVLAVDDPSVGRVTVDAVSFADGVLRLEMNAQNAVIEGRLSADGTRIEGSAARGADSIPLTLERIERPSPGPQADPEPVAGTGGSSFDKNDITYSTAVATPHVKWATKLPGGPIKGFFIPSVQYGRDMVELMQRLELSATTVSIDREWDINCWGIGDFYGHRERGDRDDFRVVYGYVEKDLTGPASFEVIVIPGLNGWSRMTRATRDAILERVEDGAGLVLIHPFVGDVRSHPFAGDEAVGDERLWKISPLVGCLDDIVKDDGYAEVNPEAIGQGKWYVAQEHFITRGLPLDLLPEGVTGGKFYKYRATGDVLVKSGDYPIMAVKTYGKGRVVALAYVEQGFMPEPVDAVATRIYWDYWEYQYALLARCILWAARRDNEVTLQSFTATPEQVEVRLTSAEARAVGVELIAKSDSGERIVTHGSADTLAAGDNTITIPMKDFRPMQGWPGGRVFLNMVVHGQAGDETGASLAWGATSITVPKRATLTGVRVGEAVYRRGDLLRASVRTSGDLSGLTLRFEVSDDLERVVCAQTSPADRMHTFEYRLADFVGRYAVVCVELVDGKGVVVDQLRAAPAYVAPKQRRESEYRASIGFNSIRPYFGALRLHLMNAAGVEAGTTWSEGVDNGLDIPRGHFGVYHYRRGPTTDEGIEQAIAEYERTGDFASLAYNTKRELYSRTKDKKFLERTPCFDDPAVIRDMYHGVYASAKSKSRYNMDYYFVGDEGSLTSYRDAFDFCWGPHTLAAFRQWLKTEYGSLDALNREWKTEFRDWESVVPYTTEEAVQSGNFAPWADHRTYMEIVFARAYQTARDAVVAADPDGHIAVSGTQSTGAYNGCDWYRLDQVIDDFLSYAGGNQWDLHRSFAKPGALLGFWTGYGSSGMRVQNAIWNAAIRNVLHPNIFWMYSYLDPDFTYSRSARDMGEAFKSLRLEGVGRLFAESARLHDGIALHYSMPSVHADSIYHSARPDTDGLRSLSRATSGWVQIVNDLAMQFDFVSYDQLEKGALGSGEYRVFIMPLSLALSPEEVQAIKAFAEGGGVVIADAGAGAMDDHCAWVEGGQLNEFFGIETAPMDQRLFTRVIGDKQVTPEGEAWGLKADALAQLDAVEPLTASTGTPLLTIGDSDAVVVREVGKGWAIYLNACLDRYGRGGRRRRGPEQGPPPVDTGPAYRALLETLLAHLDVRPAIQVLGADGQPLSGAQVVRYRFDDSEAVAVVTESVRAEAVEGRDGVTIYRDENLGDVARQDVIMRLPRKYRVTNARDGESLGYTDTVKTTVIMGGAVVLGLAQETNTLTVVGPTSGALGDHPQFTIASSALGRSLVRCHFFGPDGSFLGLYAQNVIVDKGTGPMVLPSAVSDAAGEYTLKATDVITGASAEAKVLLR